MPLLNIIPQQLQGAENTENPREVVQARVGGTERVARIPDDDIDIERKDGQEINDPHEARGEVPRLPPGAALEHPRHIDQMSVDVNRHLPRQQYARGHGVHGAEAKDVVDREDEDGYLADGVCVD